MKDKKLKIIRKTKLILQMMSKGYNMRELSTLTELSYTCINVNMKGIQSAGLLTACKLLYILGGDIKIEDFLTNDQKEKLVEFKKSIDELEIEG